MTNNYAYCKHRQRLCSSQDVPGVNFTFISKSNRSKELELLNASQASSGDSEIRTVAGFARNLLIGVDTLAAAELTRILFRSTRFAVRRTVCTQSFICLIWPPHVIEQTIIFLPCGFFFYLLSSIFYLLSSIYLFSSPNLSRRRLDVYHTSIHCVALTRI